MRIQKDGGFCAKARMPSPGEFWFGPCPNPADLFLSMCFDDQKAVQISNSTLLPQVSKCFLKRTDPCVRLTAGVWGAGWCGKSLCTPEARWALRVRIPSAQPGMVFTKQSGSSRHNLGVVSM